jgi:hypothetical protein
MQYEFEEPSTCLENTDLYPRMVRCPPENLASWMRGSVRRNYLSVGQIYLPDNRSSKNR